MKERNGFPIIFLKNQFPKQFLIILIMNETLYEFNEADHHFKML